MKQVILVLRGNALHVFLKDDPTAVDILKSTLTYKAGAGEYKQGTFKYVWDDKLCAAEVDMEHGRSGRVFVTYRGFLTPLGRAFEKSGYKVVVRKSEHGDFIKPLGKPQWTALDPPLIWRPGQKEIVEQIAKYHNGVFVAPTALGKSTIVSALPQIFPDNEILITTHAKDVLMGFYDVCRKRCRDVGIICTGAPPKSKKHGRVTCVSGKSLARYTGKPSIVVVDEVHEFGTDDYIEKLVTLFPYSRMFGFTASFARSDNRHFELRGIFGDIRTKIQYKEGVQHGSIVPIRVQWVTVPPPDDSRLAEELESLENFIQLRAKGVWNNSHRNQAIVDTVRTFKDEQVLIVVETVEHALQLKKLLPEFDLVFSEGTSEGDRWQRFVRRGLTKGVSQMTPKRRSYLKRQFELGNIKKMIATPVWKRGVDFRALNVVVMAGSSSSRIASIQIPGRVARTYEGKEYGIVIDFMDAFNDKLLNRSLERKRHYAELGWSQSEWEER